ncbi:MAG: NPCBM/NEW2 domain-containing protein [Planctomycetota bacterium]
MPATVELRDGRAIQGTIEALRDGQLRLTTSKGSEAVPLADFVVFTGPSALGSSQVGAPTLTGAALMDVVMLAGSGDRLMGHLVGGDAYGLRFELAAGPIVELSFESVARLFPRCSLPLDRLELLEDGGADDRLWRRREDGSFDGLRGVVDQFEDRRVVFEGALGRMTFGVEELIAVVFASSGASPGPIKGGAAPKSGTSASGASANGASANGASAHGATVSEAVGLPVAVALRDGSRFEATLVSWAEGRVQFATPWAPSVELPASAVASLLRRGDGVRLLADIRPVLVEERPSLGEPADLLFPWRAELSVTGRPLSVGGVPRASGLGVHALSRLVLELPPGAQSLRVTVGFVDEVAEIPAQGSVSFELLVDGKRRAFSGTLREGEAPRVLRIDDLGDARRIELITGDGGDDDAGDRAAWVDGLLLLADRDA